MNSNFFAALVFIVGSVSNVYATEQIEVDFGVGFGLSYSGLGLELQLGKSSSDYQYHFSLGCLGYSSSNEFECGAGLGLSHDVDLIVLGRETLMLSVGVARENILLSDGSDTVENNKIIGLSYRYNLSDGAQGGFSVGLSLFSLGAFEANERIILWPSIGYTF